MIRGLYKYLFVIFSLNNIYSEAVSEKYLYSLENKNNKEQLNKMQQDYINFYNKCCEFNSKETVDKSDYLLLDSSYSSIYSMVEDLCIDMDIKVPPLYIYKGNDKASLCNAAAKKNLSNSIEYVVIGERFINHPSLALNEIEMRAILAHELAHIAKKHLPEILNFQKRKNIKLISLFFASSFIVYYIVSKNAPLMYDNLNIKDYDITKIKLDNIDLCNITKYKVMNYILSGAINRFLNSIYTTGYDIYFNKFRRNQENEADSYSCSINKDKESLVSALWKMELMMAENNIGLSAHKKLDWFKTIFSSHPLTADRYLNLKNDSTA